MKTDKGIQHLYSFLLGNSYLNKQRKKNHENNAEIKIWKLRGFISLFDVNKSKKFNDH